MKRLSVFAVLVVAVAALAWSAGGQEGKPSEAAKPAVQTVEMWSYGGQRVEKPMTEIVAKFMEKNPNIKISLVMFPDWTDLHQKLLMNIAAGNAPDAANAKPLEAADLMARGTLYALDPLVQKHGVKLDDFADALVKAGLLQGKHYLMPTMMSVPVLYYNTTLFKQAGLDKAPDTWDEMVSYAKKLTKADGSQWGYFLYKGSNDFLLANWQSGNELLTPDNKAPAFNTPKAVEAVQTLVDLQHKHKVTPAWAEQNAKVIYQNRVAMWPQAMSRLGVYKLDAPALTYGTAVMPKRMTRTTIEMGNASVILKDSKNADGAFQFLLYLATDPWAQKLYTGETGYASASKQILKGEPYTSDPILKAFQWQILNDVKSRPVVPNIGEVFDIISEEMEQTMYLKKTPAQMLTDAEARTKKVLGSF